MEKGTLHWNMTKYERGVYSEENDEVAIEFPLTIHINGEEYATMVCTPLYLEELVIGFLATEGIIRTTKDVKSISIDKDMGFAYIDIHRTFQRLNAGDKRWIGSCCGKSRSFYFQGDAKTARTVLSHFHVEPEVCLTLMNEFHNHAEMFQRTGGVHQAALADKDGMQIVFSDIGRHNALDKLYGYMLKHSMQNNQKIIIFSGRISSEVLLKVSKMGIGFLLSKSAPTNLALELAYDLNITAAGFVRNDRMNIYTHPERIIETNKQRDLS
ncbi:formate dehydrogenase accessory sulfurtransferase FdhD [Halobacillus rhizosphaerae]|uniref:formate dehydrogenase accessory sulfurtransferase FdhD n=1 Tax=Halobacillus rhizosphaerae TaxID=3064889 RepID=UPI00398BA6CE